MTKKHSRSPDLLCTLKLAVMLGLLVVPGCLKSPSPVEEEKQDRQGVIGRRTTDIGEFDPSGAAREADLSIDTSRPLHAVTAGAYKNILGRAAQLAITQAVNLFHAEHDRYPRDHEEFMEKIIRYNGIELPVLPGGLQFQYDVENHELKIVEGR
jgi:hypothetical protein